MNSFNEEMNDMKQETDGINEGMNSIYKATDGINEKINRENEANCSVLPAFDSNIKSLVRDWHVLKNVSKSWNIKDSIIIAEKMELLTNELKENWNLLQSETSRRRLSMVAGT